MARARTGNLRFKDGAWRLQVYVGRTADGTRRYATRTVRFPNTKAGEKAARAELARLVLEADAGVHEPHDRGSLAELVDLWIEAREPDWDPDSTKITRARLTKHVLPTLGKKQVDRIRRADISALYGQLRRRGLTGATVRRIHSALHAAFAYAVEMGMIPFNPAADLGGRITVKAQPPKKLPDPKRIRAAIDAAPKWLAMLLRLAVHTGARRGELVRLRWDDVDLDAGTVTYHQTKTDSYKAVPLGGHTAAALTEWRRHVVETSMRIGAGNPEWVFPSWRRRGEHVTHWAATNAWAKLRADHGLDDVRLHDLRHAMATRLISTGTDVRTVADRGGWANPSVLLGTYSHGVDTAARAAAAAMDDWLYG